MSKSYLIETINSTYEFETEDGSTGVLSGGRIDHPTEGVVVTLMTELAPEERPIFMVHEDCFLAHETDINLVKSGDAIRLAVVKKIMEIE